MALLYIVLSVGIVLFRLQNLPMVFKNIFEGAFKPAAVTGGAVGSLFMSMKKVFPEVSFPMRQVLVPVLSPMPVQIPESR